MHNNRTRIFFTTSVRPETWHVMRPGLWPSRNCPAEEASYLSKPLRKYDGYLWNDTCPLFFMCLCHEMQTHWLAGRWMTTYHWTLMRIAAGALQHCVSAEIVIKVCGTGKWEKQDHISLKRRDESRSEDRGCLTSCFLLFLFCLNVKWTSCSSWLLTLFSINVNCGGLNRILNLSKPVMTQMVFIDSYRKHDCMQNGTWWQQGWWLPHIRKI